MAPDAPDDVQESINATKVAYRRLGKSGLKVSMPILGAMSFGDKRWMSWVLEEEESLPILKAAYDRGLNTWDTANIYSNGISEEIIGKAIKKYDIPRHKLVLLSKCFAYVGEEPGSTTMSNRGVTETKDYVNKGGLSRGAIIKAVDNSLKRLGTDYLDLLQIHRFDDNTPIEETMEALHDVVKSGKVHYIGASSMFAYQFVMMQSVAEKNGWTKFISMQNHYNLLYREEEREMNKFCRETGVGLIPWAPLCRGHLARAPEEFGSTLRSNREKTSGSSMSGNSDVDKQIVLRVKELADKKGWSMSSVALAWINKTVTSPIIGFSSVKRIDEALEMKGKELSDEERKYLEELYIPKNIQGHS